MKKVISALLLVSATVFGAERENAFKVREVHLDLARQMESVDFICDYIDLMADAGYTRVQLYFEGRLKTPTTQALPDEECYSAGDIRRITEKAAARGIEVLPMVEALGHAEHFFRDGKLKHLSEERDGVGRWGKCAHPSTFCPSLDETKEFLRRYITEVAAMFPGPCIGTGLDESWNMGFCRLCAERCKKEGFGGIFARHVEFLNDVVNKCGKTMVMYDDFYEFFPEYLKECPTNVVFCHWIYDRYVSRWGHRGHFAQRVRRDLLREYSHLGIRSVAAGSLYFDYDNIRSLTEYAAAAGSGGMCLTQWEMAGRGHGQFVPAMAAFGKYWKSPDRYIARDYAREGLEAVFPKLTDAEKDAIAPTMHIHLDLPPSTIAATLNRRPRQDWVLACEAAIAAFRRSAYAPGEEIAPRALSPEALADDYVCQLRMAVAKERLRLIGPALSSPRRERGRVAQSRRELAAVRSELVEIAARRRAQQTLWRKGCFPSEFAAPAENGVKVCDRLLALGEEAEEDEWWLEAALSMPEYHMVPRWNILVKVDGKWRRIACGGWKAEMRDWANFEHIVPFRLNGVPSDIRVEYSGCGPCSMTYISLENRSGRYVPKALTKTEGLVRNAENLLVDNWKTTSFGYPDTMDCFHRPELFDIVSAVELELRQSELARR